MSIEFTTLYANVLRLYQSTINHRLPRIEQISWKQIAAGGAAGGTLIAAYKISNGIEDSITTGKRRVPWNRDLSAEGMQAFPPAFFTIESRNSVSATDDDTLNDLIISTKVEIQDVYLDELDKELTRRKHRFVRYADDCVIFCKTVKASADLVTFG